MKKKPIKKLNPQRYFVCPKCKTHKWSTGWPSCHICGYRMERKKTARG